MHTIEQVDISVLPEKAQEELYDFFLFLKQRYMSKPTENSKQKYHDEALEDLLDHAKKHPIYVDPSVDIRALINETSNPEI